MSSSHRLPRTPPRRTRDTKTHVLVHHTGSGKTVGEVSFPKAEEKFASLDRLALQLDGKPAVKMETFQTSDGRGTGLRVLEDVKQHQAIVEYTGERITRDEANRRRSRDFGKPAYLFDIGASDVKRTSGDAVVIDASDEKASSVARYINHSCFAANIGRHSFYGSEGGPVRCLLVAACDIKAGSELLMDYNERDPSVIKHYPWLSRVPKGAKACYACGNDSELTQCSGCNLYMCSEHRGRVCNDCVVCARKL